VQARLMMSTNNIFSPSSGKPILTPSQTSCSARTISRSSRRKKPAKDQRVPLLAGLQEVLYAEFDGALRKHDWLTFRIPTTDG